MADRLARLVLPSRRLRLLLLQPVAELVGRHVNDVIEFSGEFVRTIMTNTIDVSGIRSHSMTVDLSLTIVTRLMTIDAIGK